MATIRDLVVLRHVSDLLNCNCTRMRSVYRCHHFYYKNKILYIFSVVISETVGLANGLRFLSEYFVVM